MLSLKMHILLLTNELMTIMFLCQLGKKGGTTCKGYILTPSLMLQAIAIPPLLMSPWAFRVYYAQGLRCWKIFYLSDIIAPTLLAKMNRRIIQLLEGPFVIILFFSLWLAFSAVSVCLFAFIFFFAPLC